MLKLVQTAPCEFDLALDDDSDNAAVSTLIYALLFTDSEAPARRIPDKWDRRGWYKSPQSGSALWHVRRQPLTEDARREAVTLIIRALSRDSALRDITVEAAGNVSSVSALITGTHNGRKFVLSVPLSDARLSPSDSL